jgi:hypothetical protein
VEAQLQQMPEIRPQGMADDEHPDRVAQPPVGLHLSSQSAAVPRIESGVAEEHVERPALGACSAQGRQGGSAVGHGLRGHVQGLQVFLQHLTSLGVGVGHQNAQTHQVQIRVGRGGHLAVQLQGNPQPETAALPLLALHADLGVHQLGEISHEGQPETCTALGTRNRVPELRELLEDALPFTGRDSGAAVLDRDLDDGALSKAMLAGGLDENSPRGRKLQSVAVEVGDHLPDAHQVADHVLRGARRVAQDRLEVALVPGITLGGDDLCQQSAEVEGDLLQGQAIRLRPGDVQDVVDDVQQ